MLPLLALTRYECSTIEANPPSHCRTYRTSLYTGTGYYFPKDPLSSFTSRMVSSIAPYSLKPLADYFFTPSPAEHPHLHDHFSLIAMTDNRVIHGPPLIHPHSSIMVVALAKSPFVSEAHSSPILPIYVIDLCPVPAPQTRGKRVPNITFICCDCPSYQEQTLACSLNRWIGSTAGCLSSA